jgi:hypothetical protein
MLPQQQTQARCVAGWCNSLDHAHLPCILGVVPLQSIYHIVKEDSILQKQELHAGKCEHCFTRQNVNSVRKTLGCMPG